MEQLTIRQLTFDIHPINRDRMVLVALSDGQTYYVQDAGGDPCYQAVFGKLTPKKLEAQPELTNLLQAVGEFYKFWLSGGEDPLSLFYRKQSPALHELYESIDGEADHDLNLREWLRQTSIENWRTLEAYVEVTYNDLCAYWMDGVGFTPAKMEKLRQRAQELGWQPTVNKV